MAVSYTHLDVYKRQVYDEVVYLLVEDAGAYQTDAAEVVVGTQVEVVGDGSCLLYTSRCV